VGLCAAGPVSAAHKKKKKVTQIAASKPVPSSLQSFDGDKADPSFTSDQVIAGIGRIAVWNNSSSDQAVAIEGEILWPIQWKVFLVMLRQYNLRQGRSGASKDSTANRPMA
jgi:hypothetical protein